MGKTITAIFDGTVLRLESPVDLEPDTRYLVTVEALRARDDWAQEHDHYLYGTPRRQTRAAG